jgi:hypothetical protein
MPLVCSNKEEARWEEECIINEDKEYNNKREQITLITFSFFFF